FQYQSPGSHGEYDLFSYGADGTPGGDGYNKDIDSWQ
ncbi:MAG: type II secretion system protein GspG, partial [Acidobacteriota bacterium]